MHVNLWMEENNLFLPSRNTGLLWNGHSDGGKELLKLYLARNVNNGLGLWIVEGG